MISTPSQPEPTGPMAPLALPENGTTVLAEELRVRLVMALDSPDPVEIDASQVENVGQAVLQLLVAAHDEAREADKPFTFINPSAAFRERVERCHLSELIGLEPQGADA